MKVKDAWVFYTLTVVVISILKEDDSLHSTIYVLGGVLFFYLSWICELLQEKKK